MVEETQLLARGVFVLDADGIVRYAEIVEDVTHHPNYEGALAALEELLAAPAAG